MSTTAIKCYRNLRFSPLLGGVGQFITDVSGQRTGPIFNDPNIRDNILFSFSISFDTISEDGVDTVYGNVSDKLAFALQKDRRTKISATPMRIHEMLRVCRGLHFHGDSAHGVLTDEKLKKKYVYNIKVMSLNFHKRINKVDSEDYYAESLMK